MISVVVVNYHSAGLVKLAVESVLAEDEKVEVFVVDNTATVEERELLQAFFKERPVNLIFNESNLGFGRACNQAYSLSRGEYVFLLNPDAYVVPPCLGALRKFLEETPDAGAAAPLIYWDSAMTYLFPRSLLPSPLQDIFVRLSLLSHTFGRLYSFAERRKNLRLWRSLSPVSVKSLSGGAAFLRRASVEDAGGLFDERFFLFYEDSDLFLRMQKAGFRLYVLPQARAVHRHRHTGQKLDIMARTRALYHEKHFSDNVLQRVSSLIPGPAREFKHIDCGTWDAPPSFPVPAALSRGYLFEWSPSPFFVPSVGFFGAGENFIFSGEIWDALDTGCYYSRFTDPERSLAAHDILCWRKG